MTHDLTRFDMAWFGTVMFIGGLFTYRFVEWVLELFRGYRQPRYPDHFADGHMAGDCPDCGAA